MSDEDSDEVWIMEGLPMRETPLKSYTTMPP